MAGGDGLQGRAGLRRGVLTATQKMRRDVKTKVMTDAWDIAAKGHENAAERIVTVESALKPGKEGRVLTGKMLGALDSYATQKGNSTTAVSGWVDVKEDYFAIQDQGGEGTGIYAGQSIWGMQALIAAKQGMVIEAKARGYEIQ